MEQAHADQPPVVIDALDRVPVQLELSDNGGWEVNPAGMQLRKSDRLVTGLAQSLQQQLLLGVRARHDRIVAFRFGDWGLGGAHRRGRLHRYAIVTTGAARLPRWTPRPRLRLSPGALTAPQALRLPRATAANL
jgi:hypothetical protein